MIPARVEPCLDTFMNTSPGRPCIRSEAERLRSMLTVPGGSASLSDSVSTWA